MTESSMYFYCNHSHGVCYYVGINTQTIGTVFAYYIGSRITR